MRCLKTLTCSSASRAFPPTSDSIFSLLRRSNSSLVNLLWSHWKIFIQMIVLQGTETCFPFQMYLFLRWLTVKYRKIFFSVWQQLIKICRLTVTGSLTAARRFPSVDTFQPWFHFSAGGSWTGFQHGSSRFWGLQLHAQAPGVVLLQNTMVWLERQEECHIQRLHFKESCQKFLITRSVANLPSSDFLAVSSFSSLVMKRSRSSSTTVRVVWTWFRTF